MRWRKTGVVIEPPVELPWVASHAALPDVKPYDDESVLVYFTARDHRRRSQVASGRLFIDADGNPAELELGREPLLTPGAPGTFDDSGTMTGCVVAAGDRERIYYQGWTLSQTVPFTVYLGCAERSVGQGPFERVSEAPVLGAHATDPIMCASPWVTAEDGLWRMWYASNRAWVEEPDGRLEYRVHVRYADSQDGLAWRREGHVCLDFSGDDETTITRPVVLRDADRYRMWFSHRGKAYRIGYAESEDGLVWERDDARAGIDVSESGFDSEMLEYACVFDLGGRRHMLYNGNGFGATGIGHAVLES